MQSPSPLTVFAPYCYDKRGFSVIVASASQPIIRHNSKRVYFNMFIAAPVAVTTPIVSFDTGDISGGSRYWDANGNFSLTWDLDYHLVCSAMYISGVSFPVTFNCTEVWLTRTTMKRGNDVSTAIRSVEEKIKRVARYSISTSKPRQHPW